MSDASASSTCAGCERTSPPAKRLLGARNAKAGEVFVCDRCVRECAQVIADAPTRIPGTTNSCSFCLKREGEVALIVTTGRARICDECVDAYRAALEAPGT